MEASRGSPAWWLVAHVDIGQEELETLEEIDPHWRAQQWLEVATQGIRDEEVLWHELLTLLTSGAEGVAKQWNIKVQGEGMCSPSPSILDIGQFLTDEEVEGAWESHTGSWPTPLHYKGWVRWPTEKTGRQGGRP